MSPALDPVQLGQTLGAVAVVAVSCVAAIRQGLARWKNGQDAAQVKERRKMRRTVRAELAKHLAGFTARLEELERRLGDSSPAPTPPSAPTRAQRRQAATGKSARQ